MHHLHAERAGHVRLIAVALDRYVLRLVERLVRATVVDSLRIGLGGTLVAPDGSGCINTNGEQTGF